MRHLIYLLPLLLFAACKPSIDSLMTLGEEPVFDGSWSEVSAIPENYTGKFVYEADQGDLTVEVGKDYWIDYDIFVPGKRDTVVFSRYFEILQRNKTPKSMGMILCADKKCTIFYKATLTKRDELLYSVCMPYPANSRPGMRTCNVYKLRHKRAN